MLGLRPRFWPTVITLPLLALCLALGVWQIHRLAWKRALIAELEAGARAAPVPAPQTDQAARSLLFRRVVARGTFLHDKEIFLAAILHPGEAGFDVLTPLQLADGRIIIVNRGFVPEELRDPATRAAGEIPGRVRVVGLLRLPPRGKPNPFLPDNRPDRNEWYWIDLRAMARADALHRIAPFTIDADAAPNPGGWPKGGLTRVTLPNHHLQYSLTWFSLAAAMAVIYYRYHRQRPGPA
jgi:surfeit locus 1 family protein